MHNCLAWCVQGVHVPAPFLLVVFVGQFLNGVREVTLHLLGLCYVIEALASFCNGSGYLVHSTIKRTWISHVRTWISQNVPGSYVPVQLNL